MKRAACLLLAGILTATAPAECSEPQKQLFVSVLKEPPVLSSREKIAQLIAFSKESGVNTLFVQVYRSNKAWFPSTAADDSPYRECLKKTGEDPFQILIREAHHAGIEVHAWLNLLSLSANTEAPILKKYDLDILTRKSSTGPAIEDHRVDNQFFLEPSDFRVRRTLQTVVGELLRTYPGLDGIQFDYIRYPDKDPFYGYSPMNMRRFHKRHPAQTISEENKDWKDWRRAQVSALVRLLGRKARAMRPGLQVSTTGLMSYSRAFHESFQDWKLWLSNGSADFVTLMCYAPDETMFEKHLEDARRQMGTLENVNIAVGAYRFLDSPQTFERQMEQCDGARPRGCAVLDYGDLIQMIKLSA